MSDFKCVLIESALIADISSEEVYGVQSGPAQSTYQQFQAVSASNSSIVFNIQVPSENIVIDKNVLINSTITLTINLGDSAGKALNAVPVGEQAFNYGLTSSLQAFPFNSLWTTTQATINNVSTSTNLQDVLPMLMRMNDNRKLNRWNSMTPSLPDCQYGVYQNGILANNNPLAGFTNNGYDENFCPRGAYPVQVLSIVKNGNPLDDSVISTAITDTWEVVIKFEVTEPFLALSPFINSNAMNRGGLVGINNMSFVLNIDNTCRRVFSNVGYVKNLLPNGNVDPLGTPTLCSYVKSIKLGSNQQQVGFQNTRLLFNFLSLNPEQYGKIATKNVSSYMDYPRYLTTFTNSVSMAPGTTQTITSQNIQLNQVPDLILICARVPMSQQTSAYTSSFMQINTISCNFNNASGLLASATKNDLYKISVANGSAQSFFEWGGAVANDNSTGGVFNIPSTGSLLVLSPAYNFSLPSYLSASSLGQFQFQFNLNITNQFPYTITPELCIITVNSGLFVCQQGTAQIFTGILTKDQVLRTKAENPVAHLDTVEYQRLVGGNMANMGMSNISKMVKHYKKNKGREMPMVGLGAGMSGGDSGGRKGRLSKHFM